MSDVSDAAEQVKKSLTAKPARKPVIPDSDWLSLGCTVLNLACSGRAIGGIAKGMFLYLVGDSASGKTWYSLQILGEAAKNKNFKDHRFIFDNAENGAIMDIANYFGDSMYKRLEPPRGSKGKPANSTTIEEFYYNLDDAYRAGDPFIYVLDSMDAVDADADEAKFLEHKEAWEDGKEAKGSYGMAKAKLNSQNIKRYVSRLPQTGSILIVLSQTRDLVSTRPLPFPMKTRAGGKALRFYAHLELWTSVKGDIKKRYLNKDRDVGKYLTVDLQKNRICGWEGKVTIPFLRKFGVDEVGACVEYLAEEHWTVKDGIVTAPEFDFKGKKEQLIQLVQDGDDEDQLQLLTQKVWREIDEASTIKRKPRYT